ncbi:MAG: hypothetical protein RLY86_1500 [Pseudomonadota bacterium]
MPQDLVARRAARAPIPARTGDAAPILVPGVTCWRIARADRFSLIVDAADYFAAACAAMAQADRSIIAVGWEFDLRIPLRPDLPPDAVERSRLGPVLQRLVERNPRLEVFILQWDGAVLRTVATQIVPLAMLSLMAVPRIHVRLDGDHPLGASHHQKILVVDDSLAFCGGIDMTAERWDTSDHAPGDPRRRRPDGTLYGPFHDVTTAVDGPAAAALADLARERWSRAGGSGDGGEDLPPRPAPDEAPVCPWPRRLPVTLRDVDVAIARTEPAHGGREAVREVEALYLAAIAGARRFLYLESQYFAAAAIRDALAARLAEPDGPEVVVICPREAENWMEQLAMDTARADSVASLRDRDPHGRFRIWYPVNRAGEAIYVHAKVLIMDDRLLRIGSSNLNNRSLGFDTECDIAVEAVPGRPDAPRVAAAIRRLLVRLLAEHLGQDRRLVAAALGRGGSLIRTVEGLSRPRGRGLRVLEGRDLSDLESALLATRLMDPEWPGQGERRLGRMLRWGFWRLGRVQGRGKGLFLAGAVVGFLLGPRLRDIWPK